MNVMTASHPCTNAPELPRAAHLHPTRQRQALARLLLDQGDRNVAAEHLHSEALEAAVRASLATTLNQFVATGPLPEVVVNFDRSYFDPNISDHHYFYFEDNSQLLEIPGGHVTVLRPAETARQEAFVETAAWLQTLQSREGACQLLSKSVRRALI